MEAWILSIVGIVSIGVLLDIIIPEGEINKYIKGIFAIVTICVIVAPLPSFFNKGVNIGDYISNESDIEIDNVFVDEVNDERFRNIESIVEKMLIKAGESNPEVTINNNGKDVSGVMVKIDNPINTDKAIDLVSAYINIKKEDIKIVVR